LIPRIELAALDQIGAGHDGIVRGAAGGGLEVIIGDTGAQQQQGCGKDDAGHAVPPPMARRRG